MGKDFLPMLFLKPGRSSLLNKPLNESGVYQDLVDTHS